MTRQNLLALAICWGILLTAAIVGHAQAACDKTDYDCTIKVSRDRIDKNSKDIEAYYDLGSALQSKREFAASIAPLDAYISSGVPKAEYLADAHNLRGWSQYKLGRNDIAVEDFGRAIELFPKAHFYYNRGHSYSVMQQYDRTIADDTKALGLDPKYTSAYFDRGFAYMVQKNNLPAIADFTKVIQLDPDNEEGYYDLGTLYYRQKQYGLAIKQLDKYVTMDVKNNNNLADGYINRGLAKYYLGSIQDAVADLTKAIEIAPGVKNAYVNRAMAYRKLGKTALAAADEEKAATLTD